MNIKEDNDIVAFLKSDNKKPFILSSRTIPGRWRNRLLALRGGLTGRYRLIDAFWFVLPTSMRPKAVRRRVWDNFITYMNKEARRAITSYINADGSLVLYGRNFFIPFDNYDDFVDMVEQSIVSDQYHTHNYLKEDSVVIDAGANVGIFSVFAAQQCFKGIIYAFEPSPYTFEILTKNIAGYKNIKSIHAGLGDVAAKKNILVYPNSTTGNIMEDSSRAPLIFMEHVKKAELITVVTVDDFVEKNHVAHVDFIKIDTEGYEAKILEGARKTIKKFKPVIAMSAYHTPADRELLPKMVESISSGYRCDFVIGNEEEFICYPISENNMIN
jgi:FkbM family methyltransferase